MHFVQMTFEGAFSVTFAYHSSEGTILDGMFLSDNGDPAIIF